MESRVIEVAGVRLHVGVTGDGPDVVALSGGPGCVQYLESDDIRPSLPLLQLAALVRHGTFTTVPGVPHDFWSTDPETWRAAVEHACATL